MNIFISGGAKNGKSFYAQKRAKALAEELQVPLYYVATMIPGDDEDRLRIERHRKEREGWGFITLEKPRDICELLDAGESERGEMKCKVSSDGVFLLDSVTALLANVMFDPNDNYRFNKNAPEEVARDLLAFSERAGNVVFVSDYIYGDSSSDYTEAYVRGLAYIDKRLAEACEEVMEISAGIPIIHKGRKE